MRTLHEKEIAVVGVSKVETKYGYKIFKELVKHDFKVCGVNPSGGEILGKKIYRNLRELERLPDLVITVVPPPVTEKIVEECRRIGIKEIWMQPGSESEAAITKARSYGMLVTSRVCFLVRTGIWPEAKTNTPSSVTHKPGHLYRKIDSRHFIKKKT
ncbi:MAG: CoA-binding protein [Candidatus Omnitrophica bacterium]|nr:CoA-binding protein [Candidatus Omnitrophota bacterium]